MYLIERDKNNISKIEEKPFFELGFREKEHLQEWIAKNPDIFGEEMLIIQKELCGFNDTNERLDLLALDKWGNLVIIENKLDDSGKDVTWQALKYASYCSSLNKKQIRDIYQEYLNKNNSRATAEDNLRDFFDNEDFEALKLNSGNTQRIIMVAGSFRKEVTSTVLWLLNYKLRIQCFKVTPYQLNDQLFLNFEQIIPLKGNEDYAISMAEKVQSDITAQKEIENRHVVRKKFWNILLAKINDETNLFKNISPSMDNWIGAGTGMSSTVFIFAISKNYARVEILISRANAAENKFIFDSLFKQKDRIEETFGDSLVWERLDDKKAARIKYQRDGVSVYDENDWPKMIEFLTQSMIKFEKSFNSALKNTRVELLKYLKTENDN